METGERRNRVLSKLEELDIPYEIYEHPAAPTIEIAQQYWDKIDATHCKNLFFRNHKGNRHYLVILRADRNLNIKELEKKLKQGKISFASPKRMEKYLGLSGGSVSVFGLINDTEHHVHLFLDEALKEVDKISFHPNDNTASVVISGDSFLRFLEWSQNTWEFVTYTL